MPYIELDPNLADSAPYTPAGVPLTSVGETLATFRADLIEELGNNTALTTARLDKWINWGYRQLTSMLTLKELWATVLLETSTDQPIYQVPDTLGWIRGLAISDTTAFCAGGRELEMIDMTEYRLRGVLSGIPTQYFRYSRLIVLWPTPDAEYDLTVDFRVRAVDLAEATDSPILPVEFHDTILAYARYRGWRAMRNYPEANVALNDAVTNLRTLLNSDAEELDAAEVRVQPARTKGQLYLGRY